MEAATLYSSPFDDLVGVNIIEATADLVVATLEVTPHLHQVTGIVHGGVYATVVEVTASLGASMWAGRPAVGLSNHTDFLRSVRAGTLRAEARPVQRGQTLQLWRTEITDEQGRVVAEGKVRLIVLEPRGD
jgi:1,4-dihydroxy-2-naphthoyl-CoA hydrolase